MHKRLRWRRRDVLPVGVQILAGAPLARHPDADADDDEEGAPMPPQSSPVRLALIYRSMGDPVRLTTCTC